MKHKTPWFTTNTVVHRLRITPYHSVFGFQKIPIPHVAPVAGRVADAQQNRHVALCCSSECFRPPRIPIDRVVSVLTQVGTGFCGKPPAASRQPISGRGRFVEDNRSRVDQLSSTNALLKLRRRSCAVGAHRTRQTRDRLFVIGLLAGWRPRSPSPQRC